MNLLDYRKNITSEHGEDGVIEKIFEVIGEESRFCIELGALDGTHGSNVWSLIKEKEWSAVLIEADQTYFEKLQKEYAGNDKVAAVNAFVSFEGGTALDALLARTPIPKNFDFLSLDIDGNDYHLWDSMQKYVPRVVVVEFNPSIPNDISFIQPRDMAVQQGSSLRALVGLSRLKGYELIATTETNAFFVLKELFPRFGIVDNSLDALHTDHHYETKLFQLYDGTLVLAGNDELLWHRVKIDQSKLQVLPKWERIYPASISTRPSIRRLKYLVRKLPFYHFVQKLRKILK